MSATLEALKKNTKAIPYRRREKEPDGILDRLDNAISDAFGIDESDRKSPKTTKELFDELNRTTDTLNNNPPVDKLPVVGKFYNATNEAFSSGVSSAAKGVGADSISEYFDDTAAKYRAKLPEDTPRLAASWDYILNGLPVDTGNAAGSLLSILLPMAVAEPLGVGAAAARIGTFASKIPSVGKYLSEIAPTAFRGALTGIPESFMEKGSYQKEAEAEGIDPETARQRSWDVFQKNLPFLMASNMAQFGVGRYMIKPGLSLKRGLLGAGFEVGSQAAEEGYQQAFQNAALGRPYTYNPYQMWNDANYDSQREAMERGGAGFAIPSLLGVGVGRYNSYVQKKQEKALEDKRQRLASMRDEVNAAGQAITQNAADNDLLSGNNAPTPPARQQNQNLRDWTHKITGGKMSDEVYNKIIAAADRNGVDRKLALALATAESVGNQNDISDAGAIGVMQLMPDTARSLGVDPYNIDQNIDGGMRFLKQNLDTFGGDWKKAAAAYNAGPGAVQKYGGIPPYGETQAYVAKIGGFLNSAPSGDVQVQQAPAQAQPTRQQGRTSILGVQDYNMPVAQMESSVEKLKSGWKEIMPQIGGVLKYKFGYDPMVTSAARTREHQMRINPSSPNSWHIIREDGGDAIDISVRDGQLSAQQEQELLDYFNSTGLFNEVLYHAVVGGKHLHLGGLRTDKLGSINARGQQQQNNAQSYDPNFSEKENEMMNEAIYASQRLKDKWGKNLSPEFIYKQWALESGHFTKPSRPNNYGQLKDTKGNWRSFENPRAHSDAYVDDFLRYYDGYDDVHNEQDYARLLRRYEYFGNVSEAETTEYGNTMAGIKTPKVSYNANSNVSQNYSGSNQYNNQNQTQQVNYEENQKPLFDLTADDDPKVQDIIRTMRRISTTTPQERKPQNMQQMIYSAECSTAAGILRTTSAIGIISARIMQMTCRIGLILKCPL